MPQNHPPAVYHRSIEHRASRKFNLNANNALLTLNPNSNLDPACSRSWDLAKMTSFCNTTVLTWMEKRTHTNTHTHTHTHTFVHAHTQAHTHNQFRCKGRRVDTEQHRSRLNQPGYGGRVPSFSLTLRNRKQSTSEVATPTAAPFRGSAIVGTRSGGPRPIGTGGTASSDKIAVN